MLYALLLLGLLPALILSDVFSDDEDDEQADETAPPEVTGTGDLLDLFGPVGPDDSGTDAPLQPDIEDATPVPGDPVDPDTVLAPDIEDDPIGPGDEIDPETVLSPDEEDDLPPEPATLLQEFLAMRLPEPLQGAHDISEAEPEAGAPPDEAQTGDPDAESEDDNDNSDALWMYADPGTDGGVVSVDAFVPGQDVLRVALDPDMIADEVAVEVTASENGDDGVVSVNGEVIALLRGAPDATPADVFLELRRDLFL